MITKRNQRLPLQTVNYIPENNAGLKSPAFQRLKAAYAVAPDMARHITSKYLDLLPDKEFEGKSDGKIAYG